MITTSYTLIALPRVFWENDTSLDGNPIALKAFISDALGVERRLPKGVNLEAERERYNLCCDRIETAISPKSCRVLSDPKEFASAFSSKQIPAMTLSPEYLDILNTLQNASTVALMQYRIGASFFPPDFVATHLQGFEELAEQEGFLGNLTIKRRQDFFRAAIEYECGVIESRNMFHYVESYSQSDSFVHQTETSSPLDFGYETDDAVDNTDMNLADILRDELQKAIWLYDNGQPAIINFSNQPHNVITEVLNEFVFVSDKRDASKPVYIQVIYTDGSQGRPFPLRCLPRRAANERQMLSINPTLRVALMSMRHQEMDRDVDMAWFRNREVSKSRTLGESDEFCYAHTKKQLRDVFADGALRLYLYQTGFQPAVIGFYRGLIEELIQHTQEPPIVQVIPHYFSRKNGYIAGNLWC